MSPERREALRNLSDFHLCKEMGWTYNELMDQPDKVVKEFIVIMKTIGDIQQAEEKRNNR